VVIRAIVIRAMVIRAFVIRIAYSGQTLHVRPERRGENRRLFFGGRTVRSHMTGGHGPVVVLPTPSVATFSRPPFAAIFRRTVAIAS